jgi:hypothetical protein
VNLIWRLRRIILGAEQYTVAVDNIAEDKVLFTIPRSAVLCEENSDLKSKMLSADSPNRMAQSLFESPWMVSNRVSKTGHLPYGIARSSSPL